MAGIGKSSETKIDEVESSLLKTGAIEDKRLEQQTAQAGRIYIINR
jgi:hypothetical protein